VRRFVRRHLVPENMVLCAAGGVSRRALERALARSLPLPSAPRRPRPPRVRVRGVGRARFRRRDSTQAQLVRVAEAPAGGSAQLALALAVEVVGSDPDARLFQELRERLGLGYDVSAELEVGMDWSASLFTASAAKEDAGRLRDAVERVCRDAGAGLTIDEVARARRKVRHRLARLADARLERALTHATRALAGRPSVATSARMLERLSHAAVEDAWRRHLRAPTLTAVLSA
jgi:predicted Zn-dependent peptidase